MLWSGEAPKAESLKGTMESYFNALQGFILCCHVSTVGAGPTLSSLIHVSVKKIVDSSLRLLQGSVSLYGKKLRWNVQRLLLLLVCDQDYLNFFTVFLNLVTRGII